jgi:hypothetical protein
VLPVGIAGAAELWRGKTLRVRIGPPLASLGPNASRVEEQEYVDRLQAAILAVLPPPPPEPRDGKKPWQWLTRFI